MKLHRFQKFPPAPIENLSLDQWLVLYEGDAKFNIQGRLASDVNSVNEKSRAQMVFDYFAFAENDALTGVKVTDALEFTEFASRDTDKETF